MCPASGFLTSLHYVFASKTHLQFSFLFSPADEQVDRALHLSLAALLGSDIYNFGELVGHTTYMHNPFVYCT